MYIKDILELESSDIRKLNKEDLYKLNKSMYNALYKRKKRFDEAGEISPAFNKLPLVKVTKKKNKFEQRILFTNYRQLLNNSQTLISEYRKTKKKVLKSLRSYNINIQESNYDKVFTLFDELSRINPLVNLKEIKYETLEQISHYFDINLNDEEVLDRILSDIQDIYIEQAKTAIDYNKFFRIDDDD